MEAHLILPRLRLREMTRALFVLLLIARVARADEPAPQGPPRVIQDAHDAYAKGDYVHARELLLQAYQLSPQPELLFALAQTEFNLGHYAEAIDYFQKFKATDPPPEQAALAEQGIGAARIKLATPPPKPQPPPTPLPPPHREWDAADSALAISGVVALAGGAALFVEGHQLANDRTGTLHTYDKRVQDAHYARDAAIAATAAGALAVGGALLRWRLHLVPTLDVAPDRVSVVVSW